MKNWLLYLEMDKHIRYTHFSNIKILLILFYSWIFLVKYLDEGELQNIAPKIILIVEIIYPSICSTCGAYPIIQLQELYNLL
jgi:hypothetical protein